MLSELGHVVLVVQVKVKVVLLGKPLAGVTTATLAPCLAAFLRVFFVYQALENSVIPKRISSNKKSTNAVSIKVCPSRLLKVLICLSNMPPGHTGPGGLFLRF